MHRLPPLGLLVLGALLACGKSPAPTGTTPPKPATPVTPTPPVVPPPAIPAGPYLPGTSYLGQDGYIEYIAGNSPVILTAPHGGTLLPGDIATRACGINGLDTNTQELVRAMQAAFHARTGKYPHVVINRLSRNKLDANRDSSEATCGDRRAGAAWTEWHAFLAVARGAVTANGGKGWYMDMHGHAHAIARLELGYLLPSATLNMSDAQLDASASAEALSSIRRVSVDNTALSFSALLRGPTSLGTLYANNGFRTVPSAQDPSPGSEPYFNGGYNTARYSCQDGATLCGVQIETHFTGVRDTPDSRARFAAVTATVLEQYLLQHWGLRIGQ